MHLVRSASGVLYIDELEPVRSPLFLGEQLLKEICRISGTSAQVTATAFPSWRPSTFGMVSDLQRTNDMLLCSTPARLRRTLRMSLS